MNDGLALYLFAIDDGLLGQALGAGVAGAVVDWERRGKHRRQEGADTEINAHTVDDLRRVRASTAATVLCRVDGSDASTIHAEIECAIEGGADEILIPMVRSAREAERALAVADGRVGVGVLVETREAVERAAEICALPLSRVYVGLNDLAIERGSASIFDALVDGTVDRVREQCSMPFGVAGVTDPSSGDPIPCRLLIGELARIDADFTFLRRSFRRDAHPGRVAETIARIGSAYRAARARGALAVDDDRSELTGLVERLSTRRRVAARA